jgi:hypothetical protein
VIRGRIVPASSDETDPARSGTKNVPRVRRDR